MDHDSLVKMFDNIDKRHNKLSRNNYIRRASNCLNEQEHKIKHEIERCLNMRRFRLNKKNFHYKGKYDL